MTKLDPVIFQDGNAFFEDLRQKYNTHTKGLFILAPSGAGKTHFCKMQTSPEWIDGDKLWMGAGAHPNADWWNQGLGIINWVDKRSDIITLEAKEQGFWVMGASNYWLKPDAIVIPDWKTHKQYIQNRFNNNYDGGATPSAHKQVLEHIDFIKKWHTDHNVSLFTSIEEAVKALTTPK